MIGLKGKRIRQRILYRKLVLHINPWMTYESSSSHSHYKKKWQFHLREVVWQSKDSDQSSCRNISHNNAANFLCHCDILLVKHVIRHLQSQDWFQYCKREIFFHQKTNIINRYINTKSSINTDHTLTIYLNTYSLPISHF